MGIVKHSNTHCVHRHTEHNPCMHTYIHTYAYLDTLLFCVFVGWHSGGRGGRGGGGGGGGGRVQGGELFTKR